MASNDDLQIKIFADGASLLTIHQLYYEPFIAGFTTNLTLIRKAGVRDYERFARDVLEIVTDKPVSLAVLSDDFVDMEYCAQEIASWGKNVYVKVPITNTHGESSLPLIAKLCLAGINVNVTAVTQTKQVLEIIPALAKAQSAYISVFGGRIADCGVDPISIMRECLDSLTIYPHIELIWASPREVFNVIQAQSIGCHIITLTDDILKKLPLLGKDLGVMSIETVKMFHDDAVKTGFSLGSKFTTR